MNRHKTKKKNRICLPFKHYKFFIVSCKCLNFIIITGYFIFPFISDQILPDVLIRFGKSEKLILNVIEHII